MHEVKCMAKKGMRRPDPRAPFRNARNVVTHGEKNNTEPVPEIQGKAKRGHEKANPPPSP
jgi:hypothetical protein